MWTLATNPPRSDGSADGGKEVGNATRYHQQKRTLIVESSARVDGVVRRAGGSEVDAALAYHAAGSANASLLYYTGGEETAERRTTVYGGGRALAALGLTRGQSIDSDQQRLLGLGRTPDGATALVKDRAGRTVWHEATASIPKSVSDLFAALRVQGREAEAQRLLDAMTTAAVTAADHWLAHYPIARAPRDALGIQRLAMGESVYFVDVHSAGRPVDGVADPHAHVHLRFPTIALRNEDGRWGARFFRDQHRAAPAIDGIFISELRQLVEALGYRTVLTTHGDTGWTSFEVAEVPASVRDETSRRSRVVEAAIAAEEAARGRPLTQQEKAALSRNTRRSKRPVTRADQVEQWRTLLGDYVASKPLTPAPSQLADRATLSELVDHASSDLLAERSVWTHSDTLAYVARHAVALRLSVTDVEQVAQEIELTAVAFDHPLGGEVFTTQARIDHERTAADYLITMAGEARVTCSQDLTAQAIADYEARTGRSLSEEQRAAALALTGAEGLALMLGWAGAGKTSTLRPVCDALTAARYQVVGTSTSQTATDEFAASTGCLAWNTRDLITRARHGLLRDADGHSVELGPSTVLIVDEAMMTSVDDLAELVALAQEHKIAGLRMIGDTEQIQPVRSGSIIEWVSRRVALSAVTKNFRAKAEGERVAAQMLREGRGVDFLHAKQEQGLLNISSDLDMAMDRAVQDWGAALASPHDATQNVLLCDLRASGVDPLNDRARRHFIARGWIDPTCALTLGVRSYAVGDRVELQEIHKEQVVRCDPATGAILRRRGAGVRLSPGDVVRNRHGHVCGIAKGGELARDAEGHVVRGEGAPRMRTVKTPTRTRGTVTALENGAITVVTDQRGGQESRTIHVSRAEELDFGYAATVHTSQGQTVERAFTVLAMSRLSNKFAAYVAASRAQVATRVYAPKRTPQESAEECIQRVGAAISRDEPQRTTLDYANAEQRVELTDIVRRQQAQMRREAVIHNPATEAQLDRLQDLGVADASPVWTQLRAACEIDFAARDGVPGQTAEHWLVAAVGLTPDEARARVDEQYVVCGFGTEPALVAMRTASPELVAEAERRVAQLPDALTPEQRNVHLARTVLSLSQPERRDERDRGHLRSDELALVHTA